MLQLTHTGVCHTDAYTLDGFDSEGKFPVVLGHEGGGVVESVGEGVTGFAPGRLIISKYVWSMAKLNSLQTAQSRCNPSIFKLALKEE